MPFETRNDLSVEMMKIALYGELIFEKLFRQYEIVVVRAKTAPYTMYRICIAFSTGL